jgi:hypothetical protein
VPATASEKKAASSTRVTRASVRQTWVYFWERIHEGSLRVGYQHEGQGLCFQMR